MTIKTVWSYKHTSPRSTRLGLTLVEVVIAATLTFLLMIILLAVYSMSHRVWRKSSDRSERLGRLQANLERLTSDLRRAPFAGTTVSPDGKALSFLTSETSTGQVFYNTEGEILWDHWVVYYQRGQELIRRDVPWGAPPTNRQTPQPIESVVGPPAAFQDGQGRVLTRNLESFTVTKIKDTRLFRVSIEVQGNQNIRPISIQSTIRPRN